MVYPYFHLKEPEKYQKKNVLIKEEEIKDENISGGDDLDNESLENLQEKENLDNETIDGKALIVK